MCSVKKTQGVGSKQLWRKSVCSETNQKKGFSLQGCIKTKCKRLCGQMESWFTLFKSGEGFRVRRAAVEVRHPLCLVPTVQSCQASVIIWAFSTWSGLSSTALCANKIRPFNYLTLNGQVILTLVFFFSDDRGIFQDDNTWIYWAQKVKACFREHGTSFHTWIGYGKVKTSSLLRNFCDVLRETLQTIPVLVKEPCMQTKQTEIGSLITNKYGKQELIIMLLE